MSDAIPELTAEQEDTLEKNLVWIISSPKSGTTWLAWLLGSDDAFRFDEPLIGLHLGFMDKSEGTYVRRIDKARNRANYFFSDEYKETWKYFVRKLILNRIYAQFQNVSKKVIIKEPNGSMGSDIISECLPHSKMILLLRDGRDVLNSQITALSKGGYAAEASKIWKPLEGQRRFNHIKLAAQEWVKIVNIFMKAHQSHSEEDKILIRYEDLRKDTFEELKKIFNFLQSDIDDSKIRKIVERLTFENLPDDKKGLGTTKQFAKVGIWKERFSNKEKKAMDEIMGNTLRELGY